MLVLPTFPAPLELHTKRCVLRQWRDADATPWAALNEDPEVRRYFPSRLSAEQAGAEAQRCRDGVAQRGWGMWALELPGEMALAGFAGLNLPHYDAPFVPALEIGWRLRALPGVAAWPPKRRRPRSTSPSRAWPCAKSWPSRCQTTRPRAA